MTYDELVTFVKEEGCRVYVYNKKSVIYEDSRGTFDHNEHGPIICLAGDIALEHKTETLLHEFGHYCQYRDGLMQYLDGIHDAYTTMNNWLDNKIELTEMERVITLNTILTMEYDAERRGYKWGNILKPDGFKPKNYLKGAWAYMASIKISFFYRENFASPQRGIFNASEMTNEELYAPLSELNAKMLKAASRARTAADLKTSLLAEVGRH